MLKNHEKYKFEKVEKTDLCSIVEIYNSNNDFLEAHLGYSSVDENWLISELASIEKAGFDARKIVNVKTEKIVGYIDYKYSEETYLSIIILHNELHGNGVGKTIYNHFEELIMDQCNLVRIDVVTSYSEAVLEFWKLNGFKVTEEIELTWGKKTLPVVTMKKELK